MHAIEKKFEIEMKLKKEMSNIQELKAAANRSSLLASDVCNVLGACEQRLQQLETAVLPLYGDTARLQQIHQNMERTVKALDHVINYYMVSRELADLIQAGPHTSSSESLNIYLEALDKLAEAQSYFNKNNAQSVELENINQLYNTGVFKLETAFEELLTRNTRPLSPTTLMDMIALEEDSSVDSISVSGSGSSPPPPALEAMRAAAGWLSAAGRAPAAALLAARAPAARSSLLAFKDHLKARSGPHDPITVIAPSIVEYLSSAALLAARAPAARSSLLAFKDHLKARSGPHDPITRAKNMLHRSDSTTKKTNKIQKVFEKRANKIIQKASQTFENSTGLAIARRSVSEAYTEESHEALEEWEAGVAGSVAAALGRLARHEQRALLGLVPLPRLPQLLTDVLKDCFAILAQDVERACSRSRRACAKSAAGAGASWELLARLTKLQPDVARALAPADPAPYNAVLHTCRSLCIKSLEEWIEGLRSDGTAGAVDGTVHQLAVAALAHCHALARQIHTVGSALATEPAYARAAAQYPGAPDRHEVLLGIYMRKVLAQLNLVLRNKSEQYPDALKAVFLLNNTLYLQQGLQRSGLLVVLAKVEPDCDASYMDMIKEYKNNYLQSWNKLLSHTVLEEEPPAKLRDRDRQILKDKFASFNREWEECTKAQRGYAVPDPVLREALKRDNKEAILPPYTRFYDSYASLPFSKNPDKYVKYSPVQIATQLDGYFDEAA